MWAQPGLPGRTVCPDARSVYRGLPGRHTATGGRMEQPITVYVPAPDIGPGMPPCGRCGAAYGLHGAFGLTREVRLDLARRGRLGCPQPYRPDRLDLAEKALQQALASGDPGAVFVARGDVQRLQRAAALPRELTGADR